MIQDPSSASECGLWAKGKGSEVAWHEEIDDDRSKGVVGAEALHTGLTGSETTLMSLSTTSSTER